MAKKPKGELYRGGPKDQKKRGWDKVRKQAASRTTKQPRTASLPGLEDHAIRALDDIAAEYADIRDSRMELTRQESDLKDRTMKLMKKHGKTRYKHNGVEINIIAGAEDVKVKVKKVDEAPDDSDGDAPSAPPEVEATEDVDGESLANA